jgi:hypothetical protein
MKGLLFLLCPSGETSPGYYGFMEVFIEKMG